MIRIAGFGYNNRANLIALQGALAASGVIPDALAALKGKHDLVSELARCLDLPLRIIPLSEARLQICLTQSPRSLAAYGLGSVAEACALAAAGQGARLLDKRIISPDGSATLAIALLHEDKNL